MATTNPFDLLGDDDNDDPTQLIASLPPQPKKTPAPAPVGAGAAKTVKLPSKPLPPAQAVRDAKDETDRGGGRGGGRGFGRGRGGGRFNRETANKENTFSTNNGFPGEYKPSEDGEGGKPSERRGYGERRGGSRGGRRGGFNNGEVAEGGEYQRRTYERRSGTGRGTEVKRDGAGRGNWGTPTDVVAPETEEPIIENEKNVETEKQSGQEDAGNANKEENAANEPEEKEPQEKEMTLEEYEKVLEEKRKALQALKAEERKVVADKDFESMQLLSSKKGDEDIFVKLGSDKRKDAAEKEEKAKKAVSINEFLKPEGDRYYSPGGRGRGRGRGPRGGFSDGPRGGYRGSNTGPAPPIDDVGQFPSLGAK